MKAPKSYTMRIVPIVGFVVIIACLFVVHFGILRTKSSSLPGAQFEDGSSLHHENFVLRQQVNQLTKDYQNDCHQLFVHFNKLLESNIDPDFQIAKNAIPDVIDELCGLGTCVQFSYKAAKDKIMGTNDFDEAYMEVMNQSIIQPCLHANAVATEMLQLLNQHLQERQTKFAVDLASVCGNSAFDVSEPNTERLQEMINSVANSSLSLQQQKSTAIILGLTIETIFIRSTCSAIVKLFATPVAKICGSLSAGGICAAADGPIPVMDIVGGVLAVGGLAWTVYDIYDVTCVMPETLQSELDTGIEETRKQLLVDSRTRANDLTESYSESGGKLQAELVKELK